MKQNSVRKNAILNIIYTISNLIFPVIIYPYITRVLSVNGMGKISFFSSIASYSVMLSSFGISTYGIREVAKSNNNKKQLSVIVSQLLVINLMITLLVVAGLLILYFSIKRFYNEPVLFFLNVLLVLFTPFGLNWFYSGIEHYSYITIRNVFLKMILIPFVFILIRNQADYLKYAALTISSSIISFSCNYLYAKKFVIFYLPKTLDLKKHIKPMKYLFASNLAVSIYTNLDIVMLGIINGDREAGLYSIASKIKWILLAIVNAISSVLLPRLSNYYENGELEQYNNALNKSLSIVFSITVPMAVFFAEESFNCIIILAGKEYESAVLCMQILMPILVVSGFSNVIGNQILIPQSRDSQFMGAVVTGAGIDIIFNILLIQKFGCIGAAIATLVAELSQMSIQFSFSGDYIYKNIDKMDIGKIIISTSTAYIITNLVQNYIKWNSFTSLIIDTVIFFLVYILLMISLKGKCFTDMIRFLRNKGLKLCRNNSQSKC